MKDMNYYKITTLEDLPNEIWVDAFGFDGLYEVSNLGRVKSVGRFVNTTNGSERWNKTRILKQSSKSRSVSLSVENKRYPFTVQRIVYESFNQDFVDENKNEVIERINKVKDDNRLENLRKVTRKQSRKNTTEKGCMIFDRFHKYTKENGVFKDGVLISKKCKVCNNQVKVYGFTYGVNTCKECRNEIIKSNYEKKERITYSKLNGKFKKGVLDSQTCRDCKKHKKIQMFRVSGGKGYMSTCRDCDNARELEKRNNWPLWKKEKRNELSRIRSKESVKNLDDIYVKKILIDDGWNKNNITQDIINERKEIIRANRLIKKLNKIKNGEK